MNNLYLGGSERINPFPTINFNVLFINYLFMRLACKKSKSVLKKLYLYVILNVFKKQKGAINIKIMEYLTELHCHTSETSSCSTVKGADLVNIYKSKNYNAIVITDHYYKGYFDNLGDMPWEEKINRYLSGYRNAKKHGDTNKSDNIWMTVILGIELRFADNFNDYLVFGLNERLLYDYPMLYDYKIEKFSEFSKAHNLLFIQAHPFRNGMVIINHDYLDGIEIYNAHPWHNSRNILAEYIYEEQRKKCPFIATVGSDCHNVSHEGRAGIITKTLPENSVELASLLRSGDYKIYKSD